LKHLEAARSAPKRLEVLRFHLVTYPDLNHPQPSPPQLVDHPPTKLCLLAKLGLGLLFPNQAVLSGEVGERWSGSARHCWSPSFFVLWWPQCSKCPRSTPTQPNCYSPLWRGWFWWSRSNNAPLVTPQLNGFESLENTPPCPRETENPNRPHP